MMNGLRFSFVPVSMWQTFKQSRTLVQFLRCQHRSPLGGGGQGGGTYVSSLNFKYGCFTFSRVDLVPLGIYSQTVNTRNFS